MPFDFDSSAADPLEQVKKPVIAVHARIWLADFSARAGPHCFGGPLALDVRGVPGRTSALHRVLTLSLGNNLAGFSVNGLTELPLVYGFTHDGCRLKYRLVRDGEIEVLQLSPKSPARDWPYPDYPAAFPKMRFGLRDGGEVDPEQVHKLTWQGIQGINPAAGVVVIVPPSETYGVSLWGNDGDAELVQVVFEIDLPACTITAYNQCS